MDFLKTTPVYTVRAVKPTIGAMTNFQRNLMQPYNETNRDLPSPDTIHDNMVNGLLSPSVLY